MVALRKSWLLASLLVVSTIPAPVHAQDAVTFFYSIDDAAGDGIAQCTALFGGAGNPCDIKKFEGGVTDSSVVFRFTSATLNFGTGATAGILYRLYLDNPDGTKLRATFMVDPDSVAAYDLNPPADRPAAKDAAAEINRAAGTLTITIPRTSLSDTSPGAIVPIVSIQTWLNYNGAASTGGLYSNSDTATAASPFVFPEPPAAAEPVAATTYHQFANATFTFNETVEALEGLHVYNWTTALVAGAITYSANTTSGSAEVAVLDHNLTVVGIFTIAGNGAGEIKFDNATAGNWSVQIDYNNFTGRLVIGIDALADAAEAAIAGGGTTVGSTGQLQSTGSSDLALNENDTGTDGGKDSPGPTLGIVLAGLAALAIARRRKA